MDTPHDISPDQTGDVPEMIHVRMTHPEGAPIAEFDMPMTDAIKLFLHDKVFRQVDTVDREPNARLAAALDEAATLKPRFANARELFDALEERGRT